MTAFITTDIIFFGWEPNKKEATVGYSFEDLMREIDKVIEPGENSANGFNTDLAFFEAKD